jgi:signal transduction histidine kinase
MFASLRTRLWLSYILVVLSALMLTAVILIIYMLRSPLAYRQMYTRLSVIQELLVTEHPDLTSLQPKVMEAILQSTDKKYNVRILVYQPDRILIVDTRTGTNPALNTMRPFQFRRSTILLRDTDRNAWLFYLSKQSNGKLLLVGIKRPHLALLTILTTDIFPPFLLAGLVALLISLLVAFGLARWISDPLQSLVNASQQMPQMQARTVSPRGPREVQELTLAFNDMSARVQASQRSQRDFVANVSHELKTPLTSIQGFAQALQDGTADTDEARRHAVLVIQEEAGRMHRMAVELLDLARLDAGTADLQQFPVNLAAVLHSIAEKFHPQASTAGVTVQVEAARLPSVVGDGDRLAQVFTNLVDNALKNTPAGGRVSILASIHGPELVVDVKDTGSGIPAWALPHIFDRFYQADQSRSGGRKHGVGLGLAIAHEIVLAHGGKITVRSEPGTGSTFTVSLPIIPPRISQSVVQAQKT